VNEAQRHLLRQQLLLGAKPDLRRGEITDATPGAVEIALGGADESVPAELIAGGFVADGDIVDALVAGNAPPLILATGAPSARVYNSANISVANFSHQYLTFNSERFDNDSIHSTSSNTDRLTAPSAGVYLIQAHVRFASNATGTRALRLQVNGSTLIALRSQAAVAAGYGQTELEISTTYKLAANDYVRVSAFQDSGGALNVEAGGNFSPEFAMTKLSDG